MRPADGEQLLLIIDNMKFDDHDSCFLQCFSCSKESDDLYSNHAFPKIFKEICNSDNYNIDIQVSDCNIETLDSCQNCTFLLNLVNTG